jgi:hypothetical protein
MPLILFIPGSPNFSWSSEIMRAGQVPGTRKVRWQRFKFQDGKQTLQEKIKRYNLARASGAQIFLYPITPAMAGVIVSASAYAAYPF